MLALVAGYLWYQNYLETSPAIPFSALTPEQQAEFKHNMKEGDEAWQFFARDHISDGAVSAIDFYAEAYDIHPRNRDAVAGLKKAADALLELPDQRAEPSGARE